MNTCVRLSQEELNQYSELGMSEAIINASVALYLEQSNGRMPSTEQLKDFIKSKKIQINSLQDYNSIVDLRYFDVAKTELSPFFIQSYDVKVGDKIVNVKSVQQGILLNFIDLLVKKGLTTQDYLDSLISSPFNMQTAIEIHNTKISSGKKIYEEIFNYPELFKEAIKRAYSPIVEDNNLLISEFINLMNRDLKVNFKITNRDYFEPLAKFVNEALNDLISPIAVSYFNDFVEDQVKARKIAIENKERERIDSEFTPSERRAREAFLASAFISEVDEEMKKPENEGKTFSQVLNSIGALNVINTIKKGLIEYADTSDVSNTASFRALWEIYNSVEPEDFKTKDGKIVENFDEYSDEKDEAYYDNLLDNLDYPQEEKIALKEEAQKLIDTYRKIVDHFNTLILGIKPHILKRRNVRLSIKMNVLNDAESSDDGISDESKDIKEKIYGMSANEGHVLDSVSKRIRSMLNSLPERDSEGKVVKNELGVVKYLSDTYVYPILVRHLQGAKTYAEMRNRLGDLAVKYTWVNTLIQKLDGPADYVPSGKVDKYKSLQSEFFSSLYRNRTTYSVIKTTTNPFTHEEEDKIVEINSSTSKYMNFSEWSSTYKQGVILSKNAIYNDLGQVNTEKILTLIERVNSLKSKIHTSSSNLLLDPSFLEDYIDILHSVGITVDNNFLTENSLRRADAFSYNKKGRKIDTKSAAEYILGQVLAILQDAKTSKYAQPKGWFTYNPFVSATSQYNEIARYIEPTKNNINSQATFRHRGKSYTSYTTPNFTQITIDTLKGVEVEDYEAMLQNEYFRDKFFQQNWVLKKLASTPEAKNILEYSEILEYKEKEFKDWSEEDKYSLQSIMYANGKDKTTGWYRLPLAGELQRAGFVKFYKLNEDELYEAFTDMAIQEMDRIKFVLEWREAYKKGEVTPVDKLMENGGEFRYLPFLNYSTIEDKTLLQAMEDYNNGVDTENRPRDIVKNYVVTFLNQEIERLIEKSNKVGGLFISPWLFHANDIFFRSQFAQILGGDLANYDSIENFQKRFKQTMSSTTRLDVTDEQMKTIIISDQIVSTTILPDIKKMLDKRVEDKKITPLERDIIFESFTKINVTDGQAYRTLDGYKFVLEKSGQWTETMEEIKEKLDKAFESKEDSDLNLNEIQDFLFNIIKPLVYGASIVDTGLASNGNPTEKRINHQFKNSEALLLGIIGFATTSPAVRALVKFAKDNDIHVINFASAVKVGSQGVIDILKKDIKEESFIIPTNEGEESYTFNSYDEAKSTFDKLLADEKISKEDYLNLMDKITNTTEEEIKKSIEIQTRLSDGSFNPNVVHSIPYTSYGFQTNVVEHFENASNIIGTQMKKLLMGNIEASDSYSWTNKNTSETSEQVTLTGKELLEGINSMYNENIYDAYKEVQKIFDNPRKIEEIIMSEVTSNPRYASELIKAFVLRNVGTVEEPKFEFTLPLEDPQNSTIVESILSGISKKRIQKMEVAGGSLVQTSNFSLTNKLQVQLKEDGKSIDYIPAYVPVFSSSIMTYYSNPDGTIDMDRVNEECPEILNMIGYRIPTENKHSILPIKIIGFLPNFAGSSIILPADITTIVGSDFDVDKLYIFRPHIREYKRVVDGSVKTYLGRVRYDMENLDTEQMDKRQRDNYIFDSYWSILTSEKFAPDVLDPSGYKMLSLYAKRAYLANLKKAERNELFKKAELALPEEGASTSYLRTLSIKEIVKLIDTMKRGDIPFSSDVMHYYESQNSVGLNLVGISANANSFVPISEQIKKQLRLEIPIKFNGVTYNGYGEINNPQGESIIKNVGQFVTAAVDNVKDPVLAFMGTDAGTLNYVIAGVHLGLPIEDLAILSSIGMFAEDKEIGASNNMRYYNELLGQIIDKLGGETITYSSGLTSDMVNYLADNYRGLKEILDEYAKATKKEEVLKSPTWQRLPLNSLIKLKATLNEAAALERNLIKLGPTIQKATSLTKLDTARGVAGPTMADAIMKYLKTKENADWLNSSESPLEKNGYIINPHLSKTYTPKQIMDTLRKEKTPFFHAYYHFGMDTAYRSLGNYFNMLHPRFIELVEEALSEGFILNKTSINALYNAFITYNLTNTSLLGEDRAYDYLYNLPNRFAQILNKYPNLRNTALFKSLYREKLGKHAVLNINDKLELNTETRDQITREWDELLASEEEELKDFAVDLFIYGIFRGALGYSFHYINHLVPVRLKLMLPEYMTVIRNMKMILNNLENSESFLTQFMANYPDYFNVVSYTEKAIRASKSMDIQYANNGDTIYLKTGNTNEDYTPTLIRIDGKLYKYTNRLSSKEREYTRLPDYNTESVFIRFNARGTFLPVLPTLESVKEYKSNQEIEDVQDVTDEFKTPTVEQLSKEDIDPTEPKESQIKESATNKEEDSTPQSLLAKAESSEYLDANNEPICQSNK